MIIVEGPDGAGKSTLVRELCKELGLNQGERGTGNRDELWKVTRQDTYTALAQAVGGHHPVKVWDRLFFSEFAYHNVVGRSCEFSRVDEEFVRKVLDALECPMIFCMPPFGAVQENVEKDKQMDGVREGILPIYRKYEAIIAQMVVAERPYAFIYDYTGMHDYTVHKNTVFENCRGYVERRAKRTW